MMMQPGAGVGPAASGGVDPQQQQQQWTMAPMQGMSGMQPQQQYPQRSMLHAPQTPDDIRTLWVGDLQYWMDETYIGNCFAHTCEVANVKIIRNKQTLASEGYGFVEFVSHAAAERMLNSYNGSLMPQTEQVFRLNWASFGMGERRMEGSDLSIVGDLATDATNQFLQETFKSHYPSVKGARVVIDPLTGRSKGYGFVRFGDDSERTHAMTEMNGFYCSSRPMRTSIATPEKALNQQQYNTKASTPYQAYGTASSQGSSSEIDANNTTVFVGGLDSNVKDQDLRQNFGQYGDLVSVKMPVGKGCGFVQFANRLTPDGHEGSGKLDEVPYSVHSTSFLCDRVLPVSCNVGLSLLQECTRNKDLAGGKRIYSMMQILELDSVAILEDHLIRLFGCCGSLEEADYAFKNAANPTVYTWHAIISAYTMHGHNYRALNLYERMLDDNTAPDKYIYPCVLKACCNLGALRQGMAIHAQIVRSGLVSDVFIGSALIDMYAKGDALEAACAVFLGLPNRNVVSWNVMIAMFVQHGEGPIAFELYERMQSEGVMPNTATFSSILKACVYAKALDQARVVHEQIIAHGSVSDVVIGSSLIEMYACFGMMEEALREFNKLPKQSVVAWCIIIAALVEHGLGHLALEFYARMGLECLETDDFTFSCIIKACAVVGDVEKGMTFHDQVVKQGLDLNMVVGNSLVNMYSKCGNMSEACGTFDLLPARNVVSWSAMIAGYSLNGDDISALRLFDNMKIEDVKPDRVTLMAVLDACAGIGALSQGILVHQELIEKGLNFDAGLAGSLINMYSKCGSLEEACVVFSNLPEQTLRLWGVLIAGYACNGNCLQAINCLNSMQGQGFQPDAMVCTSILAACRHARQVTEAYRQFKSMRDQHGISPSIELYGCMVDLLSQTGHLEEAEELLDIMPIRPDLTGWMSLLKACRIQGNMNLGKWCFDQVMRLGSNVPAGYVTMSDLYAEAEMWDDAYKLERERKHARAWKKPGRAWIEVKGKVHEFLVGDQSHPEMDNIQIKLQSMNYVVAQYNKPQLRPLSSCRPSKIRQEDSCGHCEKLAIAFGLLHAPEGTPIRVTKNLQVCKDCHSSSKLFSKIEARPIVISDTYRVHEFKNGECSCGD